MPVFAYKGISSSGKPTSGLKDADSPRTLKALLKRDGVFVTDVKEANLKVDEMKQQQAGGVVSAFNPLKLFDGRKNIGKAEVSVITRQLGVLLKAGVPLSEALAALVDQSETKHVKRILVDIRQQINEGSSLADALARHGGSFEELYIHMIRAGEASGSLEAVLFRLAEFLEAQNKLKSKITSAMFYPIIMALLGSGIMIMLMTTVVPKVSAIFIDMGQVLPWNTRFLMWSSDMIGGYYWIIFPSLFVFFIGFRAYLGTPKGKYRYHFILLKLPVIGRLARMVAVSRFAKTLATMLSAGVPLLRALEIVKHILGNLVLMKVVEDARNSIKEGESIAAPLKRSGEFPPIVTHMIAVGERTGELEGMLENVAESYELEVEMAIQRMTTLMEPLMIMVMGGSVAFVVLSILQPILQMNEFVS